MRRFDVIPLKKINDVEFGMKREEVRGILGEAKEFKKSKFSKVTTDDFGYCHVYYDENDQCEAVEIFEDSEVFINGSIVFPGKIELAKEKIEDLVEDEGSWISYEQSIGIYAPGEKMESILFGKKDYYK